MVYTHRNNYNVLDAMCISLTMMFVALEDAPPNSEEREKIQIDILGFMELIEMSMLDNVIPLKSNNYA